MDDESIPAVRFKRRKINPSRKRHVRDTALEPSDDEASSLKLREILRQRKTPRDRIREAARRAEEKKAEMQKQTRMQMDVAKSDVYGGRFVAQTGQVKGKEDEQMELYVEARLAEDNFRQYGWPIPQHLDHLVGMIKAAHESPVTTTDSERLDGTNTCSGHDTHLAAGRGKLQEIDLGPETSSKNLQRTEEARRRLEGLAPDTGEATNDYKEQASKPEKRHRWQKRRNSEDLKRDLMVEEVLREAKLDYFGDDKPPTPPANEGENADDAFYEQFRRAYESTEAHNQQQRKPAPPAGPKGVKEQPKGPKLGGSRNARAAMRLQEEQAAKNKR